MTISNETSFTGPLIANGITTGFPFTFVAMGADEIEVFGHDPDGAAVTLPDFSTVLTGVAPATGSVTFESPPANGTRIWIVSAPDFRQEIAFEDGSRWLAGPVNEANDRAALRTLALKRDANRAIKLPMGEAGITLPAGSGPTLYTSVNALAAIATDIEAIADNNADVSTVADNLNGPNTIGTVAGLGVEIAALGAAATFIPAVAALGTEITTVAGIQANINTVAGVATQVQDVGAISEDVTAVAGIVTEVTEVADHAHEVGTVGQDLALGHDASFILRAPAAAEEAVEAMTAAHQLAVTLGQVVGSAYGVEYATKAALDSAMNATTLTTGCLYPVSVDETALGARTLYRWRNTLGGAGSVIVGGVSKTIGVLDPLGILNQNDAPASPNGLPHGVTLYYAARDFVTTVDGKNCRAIPNRASSVAVEPLQSRCTTKQFKYVGAAELVWLGNPNSASLVITDQYLPGPMGGMAARIHGSGGEAQHILNQLTITPIGTLCFAVWMRSLSGVNQTIRLSGNAGGNYSSFTVTPKWQRFYVSWTDVAARTGGLRIANDGSSAWDIAVDMAKVYGGATPSDDLPAVGHMYLGLGQGDTNYATVANGIYDGTGTNKTPGLAELTDPISSRELTIACMAFCSANTHTNSYIFVNQRNNATGLYDVLQSADLPQGNPRATFNSVGTINGLNQSLSIAGKGWHLLTTVIRHNRAFFYLDDTLVSHLNMGVAIATQMIDAWRTGSFNGGLQTNYKWNQLAVWRRALSHLEVAKMYKSMQRVAALDDIVTTPARNLVVFEGDSIPSYNGTGTNANKSYPDLYLQSNPADTIVSRRSVAGSTIAGGTLNLIDRAEDLDAALPPAADRVGRRFILDVKIGTNDLVTATDTAFLTNLAAYYTARKAAGWTHVTVHTILARTDAGAGVNFITRRNAVNATLRAAPPGTHFDVLIDDAADANIGGDTSPSDTAYFNADKIHLINAGHSIIAGLVEPAIDALLL